MLPTTPESKGASIKTGVSQVAETTYLSKVVFYT